MPFPFLRKRRQRSAAASKAPVVAVQEKLRIAFLVVGPCSECRVSAQRYGTAADGKCFDPRHLLKPLTMTRLPALMPRHMSGTVKLVVLWGNIERSLT